MNKTVANNIKTLKGTISVPSDKSMSHRAVIFSTLAKGTSIVKNFSTGKDPLSSLEVCKSLGADIKFLDDKILEIRSTGKLISPRTILDCGNSGTTMRFMSGILAGQNFSSTLTGDESLSKRPMKRVIEPLTLMGAKINSKDGKSPLTFSPSKLHSITYNSPISSAQVKSCILLAGLSTEGKTIFTEPSLSRNHTEILLKSMGANISSDGLTTTIEKSQLSPVNIEIFGDISSAAYFIAAALIVPESDIIIKNTGLNPARTGIIDAAKQMGGDIKILNVKEICGEPVGDIEVKYSNLRGCEIKGELIPKLIDEIPVITVLATQADGQTVISDARDLRNKESDRIAAICKELKKTGAEIEEKPDGMIINGKTDLYGNCEIQTYLDHRIAMSMYIAGLVCKKEISINDFEWAGISFPNFEELFNKIIVTKS